MTKQNQKMGLLITAMVACAVLARVLGKSGVLPVPLGLVRTMILLYLMKSSNRPKSDFSHDTQNK